MRHGIASMRRFADGRAPATMPRFHPHDRKPEIMSALPETSADRGDYKTWMCVVCGFIYNEAEGWPQDGLAPGTRWEDVPETWTCPDCGVSKADFEMMRIG